jgi:putative membrane-bound dehydrogenase-like protein
MPRFLTTLLCIFAICVMTIVSNVCADDLSLPEGIKSNQNPNDVPLTPQEALKRITVPEGFQVSLFAGEPHVRQPISFAIDDRGRLWVAECYSYREWKPEGKDRILIFEDTDNDGQFDTRKVFWDKGNYLTGLQVGFGGVWVCCTPHFMFIPDRNGDDVPDSEPVVLLDGWSTKGVHNVLNGLTWGPDGWLYGCNGITAPSKVGKPGTPDDNRVEINCGIWRYHPTRHEFDVVAHGTTNPWGLDFDEHGQAFFTNCVIAHLWHLIPGAHYKRMFGQDVDSHSYGLLDSCSDHLHWTGGDWTKSRGGKGEHDVLGGGHAHVGAMIYLGDNWPDRYRGTLFTCNVHGYRVNNDILERHGSGYVGHHGKDFFWAHDEWFRGLELQYGPDGGVYITDWTDFGECHDNDGVHRDSGRIYKVTYKQAKSATPYAAVDLALLSDAELVDLQLHKNDFYVRQSRRLLQERAAVGKLSVQVHATLWSMFQDHSDVTRKLRALWSLNVTGGLSKTSLLEQLSHDNEHIRWWALRLLAEDQQSVSPAALSKLADMAKQDESALVRLGLASSLQRLPLDSRWSVAENLLSHAEDANDQNLPLMIWYGIEPLVAADGKRAIGLAAKSKIPLVRQYIARRVAEN